jgi:tRNA1(Val) A37 N6-methylase TrmN6
LNKRNLKKEITEFYGALVCMEKSARSGLATYHFDDDVLSFQALCILDRANRLVIYDICSGKGISSFFLSFMFPNAIINMVDFDKDLKLEHIGILDNVNYNHADIHSEAFEQTFFSKY